MANNRIQSTRLHGGIALGTALAVAVFVAFLPPVPPATAQSQANRICREEGFSPKSEGYEYCLSQATRALEWGEPKLAHGLARASSEARDACLGYGLQPQTSGFQNCIDREAYARSLLVYADEQSNYGPQIADHP